MHQQSRFRNIPETSGMFSKLKPLVQSQQPSESDSKKQDSILVFKPSITSPPSMGTKVEQSSGSHRTMFDHLRSNVNAETKPGRSYEQVDTMKHDQMRSNSASISPGIAHQYVCQPSNLQPVNIFGQSISQEAPIQQQYSNFWSPPNNIETSALQTPFQNQELNFNIHNSIAMYASQFATPIAPQYLPPMPSFVHSPVVHESWPQPTYQQILTSSFRDIQVTGLIKRPLRHSPDTYDPVPRQRKKLLMVHRMDSEFDQAPYYEQPFLEAKADKCFSQHFNEKEIEGTFNMESSRTSIFENCTIAVCRILSSRGLCHEQVTLGDCSTSTESEIADSVKQRLQEKFNFKVTVEILSFRGTDQVDCIAYEHPEGVPEEYSCTYSKREHDTIRDLKISNQHGSVLWPGNVSICSVDFTKGPRISENELQLWDGKGIIGLCVVTLKLPQRVSEWAKRSPSRVKLERTLRSQCKQSNCKFLAIDFNRLEWKFEVGNSST